METHYDVLGVASIASPSQIARAYKRLALLHHPDKAGGSTEAFQRVSEANETLSDPVRRAMYDASRGIWARKADTYLDMEYWRLYDEARERTHPPPHPAHAQHTTSHAPRRFGFRFRRRAPSSASDNPDDGREENGSRHTPHQYSRQPETQYFHTQAHAHAQAKPPYAGPRHYEFRSCQAPPSGFQYTSAHYSSKGVYSASGPMPIPGAMPTPTMPAPIPTPVHHPMSSFPGPMFNAHSTFNPFQPPWSSFMRPDNTSHPVDECTCNGCPLSASKANGKCNPKSPWSPRFFSEEVTVLISFETPMRAPLRTRVLPFFAPLPPLRAPNF